MVKLRPSLVLATFATLLLAVQLVAAVDFKKVASAIDADVDEVFEMIQGNREDIDIQSKALQLAEKMRTEHPKILAAKEDVGKQRFGEFRRIFQTIQKNDVLQRMRELDSAYNTETWKAARLEAIIQWAGRKNFDVSSLQQLKNCQRLGSRRRQKLGSGRR
ncbi:hypothetical protein ACQY0O_005549 [Thecaphora frezii]